MATTANCLQQTNGSVSFPDVEQNFGVLVPLLPFPSLDFFVWKNMVISEQKWNQEKINGKKNKTKNA